MNTELFYWLFRILGKKIGKLEGINLKGLESDSQAANIEAEASKNANKAKYKFHETETFQTANNLVIHRTKIEKLHSLTVTVPSIKASKKLVVPQELLVSQLIEDVIAKICDPAGLSSQLIIRMNLILFV